MDDKLKEFATDRQREILEAVERCGSQRAAAEALGISHGTVSNTVTAVELKAIKAARNGYAPGHWTGGTAPGYLTGKVTLEVDGETGKVNRYWQRQHPDDAKFEEARRAAFEALAESLPRRFPAPYDGFQNDALCNLIVFTDYHLGMLAWHKEGGADWDLKIAEALMVSSFLHMVQAAPRASKCVLTIQGDFLHSDGLLPLTPAHKNVLDTDGRFSKIVAAAIRVLRHLVDYALTRHAEVHLVVAEGNHDEASSVWVRQMFAALYENEPRLTVNDSELPFYVHQHGDVMLCFHHGHKVKNEALPMLFAAQYPQIWGATKIRVCHTGHRHHIDEKEYSGITIVQHPTLAARDAHAARGGWISQRAAQIITYHEKFGQVARNFVVPEMFEDAA